MPRLFLVVRFFSERVLYSPPGPWRLYCSETKERAVPEALTFWRRDDTVCGVTSPPGEDRGVSKRDREHRFKDLQQRKTGRTLQEVEEVLRLYGFTERLATKEASVWKRGSVTLTLPNPKKGGLLIDYVVLVLRKIREAEELEIPEEHSS